MPLREPLPDADVDTLVQAILVQGIVVFSTHAYVAMDERGIDEADVRNVLRDGSCVGHRWAHGTWRYEICTEDLVVIVGFRAEDNAVIVTAWWEGDPN